MHRLIRFALTFISIFSIGLLAACANSKNIIEQPEQIPEVCPDTLVQIDEAVLSAAIDENGNPIQFTHEFTVETPKIYCTFIVPDICCTTLFVRWFYGEEIIGTWEGVGIGNLIPQTLSLDKPAGGFAKGDYRVTMYLGFRELVTEYFTIN